MEVNLLLQEVERFPGIVILTTNFFGALDKALVRRIQFRVTFEEPDAESRTRIWETLCPPETPLGDDVSFEKLGKHFEMTGGMIKNAIIRAAYLACDAGTPITQKILEDSCLDEYQAAGKVARDPSALPPPKIVIPDGAVELPSDWSDRGIAPEILLQAGMADAELPPHLRHQLRARGPGPHAPPPAPSAPPNPDAPKKTRPIPELADHPQMAQMAPRNARPDLDGDA